MIDLLVGASLPSLKLLDPTVVEVEKLNIGGPTRGGGKDSAETEKNTSNYNLNKWQEFELADKLEPGQLVPAKSWGWLGLHLMTGDFAGIPSVLCFITAWCGACTPIAIRMEAVRRHKSCSTLICLTPSCRSCRSTRPQRLRRNKGKERRPILS